MRSILLHVYEDDCLEARLQAALDLARQFDGHLTCLYVAPYDLVFPADFYGTVVADMRNVFGQMAQKARQRLQERLAAEDVRWDWVESQGYAGTLIANYAPLADVVLVGSQDPYDSSDRPSALVAYLTSHVRAPLLVVPPDYEGFRIDQPVALAWNGSAEAAHAMQAAMPILARAESVKILTVAEEKKKNPLAFDMPPAFAAEYLSRHDIEAEIVELPHQQGQSISDTLVKAALIRKAGCLIIGAYGHTRLRERVLGGVTRDMLTKPKMPLLLTH